MKAVIYATGARLKSPVQETATLRPLFGTPTS